jgi:hypothetical protein
VGLWWRKRFVGYAYGGFIVDILVLLLLSGPLLFLASCVRSVGMLWITGRLLPGTLALQLRWHLCIHGGELLLLHVVHRLLVLVGLLWLVRLHWERRHWR